MATRQCKARTKSGKQCGAFAIGKGAYCLTHSPTHAKERAVRNRNGGLAKSTPKVSEGTDAPRIESIGDVLLLVNWTIADTWQLENGAPRSRALLAAAGQAMAVLEKGDLEKRIDALEKQIGEVKK